MSVRVCGQWKWFAQSVFPPLESVLGGAKMGKWAPILIARPTPFAQHAGRRPCLLSCRYEKGVGGPAMEVKWDKNVEGGGKDGIPERVGTWGDKNAGKHSMARWWRAKFQTCWGSNGLFAVFCGRVLAHMKRAPQNTWVCGDSAIINHD